MMNPRYWLSKHPAAGAALAAGLIAASVAVAVLRGGRDTPTKQWFYDLQSGELYVMPGDVLAMADAPSGPNQGVEAAVFSCGDCDDPSQRFIGYLVFYTDYYKAAMRGIQESLARDGKRAPVSTEEGAVMGGGIMVRTVDGDEWFPNNSNEGAEILVAPYDRCGRGIEPRRCYPK